MVKKRISLTDVAKRVGVSMVTVSAAVNGNGRVGRELAERIRKVAHEMGYRPNAAAQILKNSPKDLGLLILEKTELIRSNASIQDAIIQFMKLSREKFRRCQMEWFDPYRYPDELPHMLTDGLIGGVICYGHAENALADFLETSSTIPIVRLDEPGTYTVHSDLMEGIRRSVHRLAEFGHRRVGMINGKSFHVFQQAKAGFETALKELNFDMTALCYRENQPFDNYPEEIYELVDYVLSFGEKRPTALLIDCAPITKAFIHVFLQKGIKVPEDISIVCFGNIDWEAKNFIPQISGLEYSYDKIISAAMDMLLDLMNHKEPPVKKISIVPELTLRESVKKLEHTIKK